MWIMTSIILIFLLRMSFLQPGYDKSISLVQLFGSKCSYSSSPKPFDQVCFPHTGIYNGIESSVTLCYADATYTVGEKSVFTISILVPHLQKVRSHSRFPSDLQAFKNHVFLYEKVCVSMADIKCLNETQLYRKVNFHFPFYCADPILCELTQIGYWSSRHSIYFNSVCVEDLFAQSKLQNSSSTNQIFLQSNTVNMIRGMFVSYILLQIFYLRSSILNIIVLYLVAGMCNTCLGYVVKSSDFVHLNDDSIRGNKSFGHAGLRAGTAGSKVSKSQLFKTLVFKIKRSVSVNSSTTDLFANVSDNVDKDNTSQTFLSNNEKTSGETGDSHGQRSEEIHKRSNETFLSPAAASCELELVADDLFFREVGDSDVTTTIRVIKDAVRRVDAIFRSTDFDQDGVGDNVGFTIGKITVIENYPSPEFPYSRDSGDHMEYLKAFSRLDHSDYCLAVAFTYRDFQGVRGVSWVASSTEGASPGGICEKPVVSAKDGRRYSFNTAVVTYKVLGRRLSQEKAAMTLVHELGHSFGSLHDGDDDGNCSTAHVENVDGPFVMSHSVSGRFLPNQQRFSACSLRLINPVLARRGPSCLQYHQGQRCGDGLVEAEEECDCGDSDVCQYNDPCCTPSDVSNGTDPPCTVRRSEGKVCSPATSPCCTVSCQAETDTSRVCHQATECSGLSSCDGVNHACPSTPVVLPDLTLCGGGSRFCVGGLCEGSLCDRQGLLTCYCQQPAQDRCKVCCQVSLGSPCLPADAANITGAQANTLFLAAGEPCLGDGHSFCDKRRVCRDVIRAYSVSVNIVSNQWLQNYWPYMVVLGLVFLLALVLFRYTVFHFKDAHTKGVHYGKIIAIFRISDVAHLRTLRNIAVSRYLFKRFEKKMGKDNEPLCYVDAVVRLRAFFPHCPMPHIVNTVHMASCEDAAVRILLAQGFAFRRFVPKLMDTRFAHLAHLVPRVHIAHGGLQFDHRRYSELHSEESVVSLRDTASAVSLASADSEAGELQKSLQEDVESVGTDVDQAVDTDTGSDSEEEVETVIGGINNATPAYGHVSATPEIRVCETSSPSSLDPLPLPTKEEEESAGFSERAERKQESHNAAGKEDSEVNMNIFHAMRKQIGTKGKSKMSLEGTISIFKEMKDSRFGLTRIRLPDQDTDEESDEDVEQDQAQDNKTYTQKGRPLSHNLKTPSHEAKDGGEEKEQVANSMSLVVSQKPGDSTSSSEDEVSL